MPTLSWLAAGPAVELDVVDDNFRASHSPFDAALVSAYTDMVGDGLADGTTGYATVDEDGYEQATVTWRAANGFPPETPAYMVSVLGGVAADTVAVTYSQVNAVRISVSARGPSGVYPAPQLSLASTFTVTTGALTTDWVTYQGETVPPESVWDAFVSRMAAGEVVMAFVPGRESGSPIGVVDVAWLRLEVDYEGALSTYRRKSSIRQLQRGGPGGLGGIPRGYGVATARGSLRRGPSAIR